MSCSSRAGKRFPTSKTNSDMILFRNLSKRHLSEIIFLSSFSSMVAARKNFSHTSTILQTSFDLSGCPIRASVHSLHEIFFNSFLTMYPLIYPIMAFLYGDVLCSRSYHHYYHFILLTRRQEPCFYIYEAERNRVVIWYDNKI